MSAELEVKVSHLISIVVGCSALAVLATDATTHSLAAYSIACGTPSRTASADQGVPDAAPHYLAWAQSPSRSHRATSPRRRVAERNARRFAASGRCPGAGGQRLMVGY